ncbi:MAG: HD domain-containing protein [Candidatus Levybacteria bacterium]|nr:HD domain-containing protein [Candidatus Levybacteria bacterium]
MYQTFDQIKALHEKYAPDQRLFELVFTHCQIVQALAQQIIEHKKLTLNIPLVYAGALLHDIGTYTFLEQPPEIGKATYYKHPMEGSRILKYEGMPEDICNVVEHHLGVGLSEDQIIKRGLDLPIQDYSPTTIEERLVLYADKFHSKKPQFNSYASYCTYTEQFGAGSVEKFKKLADEFGIPDIAELAKEYKHPIK